MEIQNGTITVTGLSEFEAQLKKLKTDNPGFEKRLRGAIKKILGEARADLRKDAAIGLQMENDPRHAYKAVRFAVYKRLLGGQVNILQSRKAGGETSYVPPRKLIPGQVGGNRRMRTSRNLNKYEGVDRGFILRFLNSGTAERAVNFSVDESREKVNRGSRGGNLQKYGKTINTGYRGFIRQRDWFGGASLQELQKVAGYMQELIDKVINEEFV